MTTNNTTSKSVYEEQQLCQNPSQPLDIPSIQMLIPQQVERLCCCFLKDLLILRYLSRSNERARTIKTQKNLQTAQFFLILITIQMLEDLMSIFFFRFLQFNFVYRYFIWKKRLFISLLAMRKGCVNSTMKFYPIKMEAL